MGVSARLPHSGTDTGSRVGTLGSASGDFCSPEKGRFVEGCVAHPVLVHLDNLRGCDRDDRFVMGKRHCREFALRGALQGQELPVCPLRAPTVRVRSESVDAIW